MAGKTLTKKDKKEMDKIWKLNVNRRDNYICQVCGKKVKGRSCHAHHLLPKRMKNMRWDVNNGITLCPNHHKLGIYSAHQNGIWFYGWMNAHKNNELRYCVRKVIESGQRLS